MKRPLCIYHGNCADGFTAAWVAYNACEGDIDLHPGVYQTEPPDVTDRDVFLVDFSYKRPVLELMREKAKSITILDHHKTAEADLKDLAGINTIFDMERSGARIAWDFWNPGRKHPQTLLHVEDRDLWRFALPMTREIQANIFSYPYELETWDRLMAADPMELAKEGQAIERKHHKDIGELIGVVTRRMVIAGHNVPIANLPYIHVSDAAHALAKGEPFAGCYWDTPKGRTFGLRSSDAGLDVSEIAKQYGGGGHRNASGFTVSYDIARTFEAP
jgi:oligoribonuclease NrnB/cAMP/cGMP phosphodiesterase (DHH superfamily)